METTSLIFWIYIAGVITNIPAIAYKAFILLTRLNVPITYLNCLKATFATPDPFIFTSWYGVFKILGSKV